MPSHCECLAQPGLAFAGGPLEDCVLTTGLLRERTGFSIWVKLQSRTGQGFEKAKWKWGNWWKTGSACLWWRDCWFVSRCLKPSPIVSQTTLKNSMSASPRSGRYQKWATREIEKEVGQAEGKCYSPTDLHCALHGDPGFPGLSPQLTLQLYMLFEVQDVSIGRRMHIFYFCLHLGSRESKT